MTPASVYKWGVNIHSLSSDVEFGGWRFSQSQAGDKNDRGSCGSLRKLQRAGSQVKNKNRQE